MPAASRIGFLAAVLLLLTGCRREMYDQPKYKSYEPSTFFSDGTSARPLVAGTVARGELREDAHFYTGKVDGKDAETFPIAVDYPTLERGRQRYQIYCTPCHGEVGDGRGMIVQRGFSPPPSFHSEELRKAPAGHFFEVMTNGHGAMYSYAARVKPGDRWAIAAYIRALQLSQGAKVDELPARDREALAGIKP